MSLGSPGQWLVFLAVVAVASVVSSAQSASQFLAGGILRLEQNFGRAVFTRCVLTVYYAQPPQPQTDRAELSCTPLPLPYRADIVATRRLSGDEARTLANLTAAADLYSGGHVGQS
jgi:hypothetical protein